MHRLMTHLRGLMVALAALALTAGVAFAARPVSAPSPDRDTNAPATTELTEDGEGTVPELADEEDEAKDEDDVEAAPTAEEAVDADADPAAAEHPLNHGWHVSQAAKAPTPDGYRNHGEYVSEVARSDAGKPGSEVEEAADEAGADAVTDGGGAEATSAKLTGKDRAAHAKAGNAERKAARAGK